MLLFLGDAPVPPFVLLLQKEHGPGNGIAE